MSSLVPLTDADRERIQRASRSERSRGRIELEDEYDDTNEQDDDGDVVAILPTG